MADIIEPRLDRVPEALTSLKQWVIWKAVPITKKDGSTKITKVPYNPVTKRQASSSKPKTWGTFEQAVDAYTFDSAFAGIGFVFSSNDDLVGIDLDSCFDDDGNLKPEAQNAVNLLDSYTEKSPSGKGLHIICRGRLPGGGHCDHRNGREMYQEDRFFTITAEIVGDKTDVAKREDAVRELYEDWFGANSVKNYKAGDLQWDDKAPIVDLDSLPINDYTRNLIRNGENMDDFLDVTGNPDRSLALFYVCREMVSALVNKETILTILTDPENYLAQAALDRRDGNIESAQEWVWKYSLAKVVTQWEEERSLYDEVMSDDAEFDDPDDDDLDSSLSDAGETGSPGYIKSNFDRNALIFLKHSTPLVRYQEQFFRYSGKHWELYSEEQVERDVHKQVTGKGFSMAQINNTIKAVKRFSVKDNFEPSPTHIAFHNGVLDLAGWDLGIVDDELLPHSPNLKTMSYLDFDYDPEAQCPEWLGFLDQVFEGDADRILLLQQWFGYLLVYDYRWQKMLVMAGESRSGKGTIANVIRHVIGPGCYVGTSLSNLASEFGLHSLVAAKVAVIGDAKQAAKGNINRAHEMLLNIAGNDYVTVNRKYAKAMDMQIPARIIMMANNVPRFADDADALFNRYLVLPFNVSFAGREDVMLGERLKGEAPGIFNWAVQGLLNLAQAGKFVEPEAGAQAADEMRVYNNPLGTFVERFMVMDPGGVIPCKDLYSSYQQYCRELGINSLPNIEFGRRLKKEAKSIQRVRRGGTDNRVWIYEGATFDFDAFSEVVEMEFD